MNHGRASPRTREPLLPQVSIRFFLALIGGCALGMYVFRMAIVTDATWARIGALIIATILGCALAYITLFLLACLFTATTAPLAEWLTEHSDQHTSSPDDHDPSGAPS